MNGAAILARGGNLVPLDELEGRNTAASHRSECRHSPLFHLFPAVPLHCSPSPFSADLPLLRRLPLFPCAPPLPALFRCFGALLTPSSSHRALVRSVADGGMNIMRIWGGGVYQLDAFYDAADEFGVLLYRTPLALIVQCVDFIT